MNKYVKFALNILGSILVFALSCLLLSASWPTFAEGHYVFSVFNVAAFLWFIVAVCLLIVEINDDKEDAAKAKQAAEAAANNPNIIDGEFIGPISGNKKIEFRIIGGEVQTLPVTTDLAKSLRPGATYRLKKNVAYKTTEIVTWQLVGEDIAKEPTPE